MTTFTYNELIKKGFKPLQGQGEYPSLMGFESNKIWILVEHELGDNYGVHAARDSNFNGYNIELISANDSPFQKIKTLDELVSLLENPSSNARRV